MGWTGPSAPARYVLEKEISGVRSRRIWAREHPADWPEFEAVLRRQAADRLRWLLRCAVVLTLAFILFDLVIDPIPQAVLEMRLLINGTILVMLGALDISLTTGWLRQQIFGLVFVLCASTIVGLAFLFGQVSPDPARLAFHYLYILGMALIAVQWFWPWQLILGVIAFVCFVGVLPAESANFGFFAVGLVGTACLMTVAAGVLMRWRYMQFCTEAQLRRADHVKSEFLSTMSHELRTPLNIIVGYSDLLQEGAMGSLSEEQGTVVNHIRRAGRDLLSLVESTLNVSRLESGRAALDITPFSLDEFAADIRADVARLVDAYSKVPVIWEVRADRVLVATDHMKLREIVLNLLSNAIKFTDSGEIRISVVVDPPSWLRITVKDSGVGIPAERLPKVFESFEQLHPSRPEAKQGVGLGLYIVKKLVELLDGRIEVDSAVGQGTEFRVRLPVRIVPMAAPVLAAVPPSASRAVAA